MWSSIELESLYQESHGTDCNRRRLVNKIKGVMEDEINCHNDES